MSSDDEEYFDEFDDDGIFWVEEADPTVADDLAAGATYDPTFLDDPSLETVECFSDWEELSDDYYDEDPTAIRRLRAMGALPPNDAATTPTEVPPTKRRKMEGPPLSKPAYFEGVAWRQPEDETDIVEVYAPGEGEKVSLLKNWRDIFRNAKPAIGRLRARKADLRPSVNVLGGDTKPSIEVPSLVPDIEGDVVTTDSETGKPLYAAPVHAQVVVNTPAERSIHPIKDTPDATLESIQEDQAAATNGAAINTPAKEKAKEPPIITKTSPSRRGRKRKASPSPDRKAPETDVQPKTKRAATSKTSQPKPVPAASVPNRRSARHKK
ncbi:hypothetical protein BJX99DRAFT_232673 [Aspergillus californicus]